MSKLEPHEFSKMFPPILQEDFEKLVADIKANGLHQPILRYQGKILDGNNRYCACSLAGIEPTFAADFNGTDAQARAYVISANIHRRHLTQEKRKEILAEMLKLDPSKSNRQLGAETKLDHKTVGAERSRLEAGGEIPHQQKIVGKDGVAQPTKTKRGGKGKSGGAKGEKETITFQKVVNAKTATNAYGVLEEHLLDALQDVNDKSDFSQADDYGRRTIEKLEEKLEQLQPEMADAAE